MTPGVVIAPLNLRLIPEATDDTSLPSTRRVSRSWAAAIHEVFERSHVLGRPGHIGNASLSEADVFKTFVRQLLPEAAGFDHYWQLVSVSPLLSYPAPVARGLFGGNASFLKQCHLHISISKEDGGAHSDNSASDDHHLGGIRDRNAERDRLRRRETLECFLDWLPLIPSS
ncbi:hypothetical protein ACVIDN_005931 [Rhizobium brockwellii]